MTTASALRGFEQRGRGFARQQIRQRGGVHQPPHDRVVGVGRRADELAGAWLRRRSRAASTSSRSRAAPSAANVAPAWSSVRAASERAPARAARRAERELAAGGLVPLAEQSNTFAALRQVVVAPRLRVPGCGVPTAAQAQELAPRARRRARVDDFDGSVCVAPPRAVRARRRAALRPRSDARSSMSAGGTPAARRRWRRRAPPRASSCAASRRQPALRAGAATSRTSAASARRRRRRPRARCRQISSAWS